MYLMYADESGSTGLDYENEQQPIFVLGAALIKDTDWHKINNFFEIEKVKLCPFFEVLEIHTNEIFSPNRKSPFSTFYWKDNLKLLEKMADLIANLDIKFFNVIIDKKAVKDLALKNNKTTILKTDPYLLAYIELQKQVSDYILNASDNDNGMIFLDEFLPLDKEVPAISWILSKEKITKNNIIERAIFLKSHASNFIQIADFYAFYINKMYMMISNYKTYSEKIKEEHIKYVFSKLFIKTEKSVILNDFEQKKCKE